MKTKRFRGLASLLALALVTAALLAGCGGSGSSGDTDAGSGSASDAGSSGDSAAAETPAEEVVVNVACRNDYPEIWDAVNKELEPEGIRVVNTAYDTSVNLNELLVSGDIEMNVAQHGAYLKFIQAQDAKFSDLESIGQIHISTLDLYSKSVASVEELPDGATIAIPNDAMNGGRALLVLERSGVITLDDTYDTFPDSTHIADNPKNLEFLEIASDSMVITLEDVDAGFVYSVNAVDGGLDPVNDPIFRDIIDFANNAGQRDFIILFTVRSEDKDNAVYKKIVDAYHTESVYQVYKDVYKGSIIPIDNDVEIDLSKY